MAQRPDARGNNRERPRKQATRRTQSNAAQRAGANPRPRPAHASAQHARPQQNPSGGKGPVVAIILVVVVAIVVGVVLFLTQCRGAQGSSSQGQSTQAQAASTQGTEGPASSDTSSSEGAGSGSNTSSSVDKSSWELTLVNKTHPLPSDWKVELEEVDDGKYVDARIAKQFKQMISDCRAAGYDDVFVNQAYRSHEEQQAIWDQFYNDYLQQGYSAEEAKKLTGESVAIPGTSEHELGLAADICSINFDETYNAPIQTWLRENGHKYGFIQRYPEGKESITGTKNENWHFRYVGEEAAKEIYESGQVLEEYLGETN